MNNLPPGMKEVAAPPGMGASPVPVRTPAPTSSLPPGMVQVATPPGMAGQSASPTPLATPHQYDDDIVAASKQYGLDPKVLRQVGMQESGLGTSPNYDPKTGLDKDGNAGHGPWQLDPASGASQEELHEAATDPKKGAAIAARMISANLKRYNGNLRMALAAYNAGDPNSAAGQAYADHVLSAYSNLDPLSLQHPDLGTKVQHVVRAANAAILQGKNPTRAVVQTAGLEAPYNKWNDLRARWEWLKKHPLEGGSDILSAPQREVSALMGISNQEGGVSNAYHDWISNSKKHQQMIREMGDLVWNPTPRNNSIATENVAHFIDNETGHKVQIPSHQQIDNSIHAAVWNTPFRGMQGALQTGAKAGRDLTLQFVSDPLSLPGGLAEKATDAGAAVARHLGQIMGPTAARYFPHLTHLAQQGSELGSRVFGVRRDLDAAGFTRDGKRIRMALENGEISKQAKRTQEFQAVAHDGPQSATAYTNHMTQHNLPVRPNDVAELHDVATPAERRMEILQEANKEAAQHQLQTRSQSLFANKPNLYRGQAPALDRLGTRENSAIQRFVDNSPLKPMRELGKKAIMWNPFPHGFKNVGTLAYMAGGLPAIARGVAGMITPVDAAKAARLMDMGALPHYLEDVARDPITHHANNALGHMEAAWRIGLMETMDKQLGVPVSEADKLMRGWLINDKLGDYRNVSAFVKFFEAMGGPFVAFRLGIVPHNMTEALLKHPERVVNSLRAKQDVQNNRAGRPQNSLEFGGPDVDWLKLITNPESFLKNSEGQLDAAKVLGSLAEAYIPGGQFLGDVYKAGMGIERPNQRTPNLADALEDTLMAVYLGTFYKQNQKPKTEMKDYKEIREGKK